MADGCTGETPGPVLPLAKAEGAFLALAAGDALGWPQEIRRNVRSSARGASPRIEFQTWTRRSVGRYRLYEEIVGAGEYSDDTQLTLAVARSRPNHSADWWKPFMRVELPRWTIYERGGGGATKRAAQAWLAGRPPWQAGKTDVVRRYFGVGGNGVAMRVLPHALFLAGQDDSAVLVHDVVRDGAATHGHPRALVGATACAYAAWSLARRNRTLGFGELLDLLIDEQDRWGAFPDMERGGEAWFAAAGRVLDEPYERLWERTVGEMRQLLEKGPKRDPRGRPGRRPGGTRRPRMLRTLQGCRYRHRRCSGVSRGEICRPAGAGRSSSGLRTGCGHRHARGCDRGASGLPRWRRVVAGAVASRAGRRLLAVYRRSGGPRTVGCRTATGGHAGDPTGRPGRPRQKRRS